MVSQNFEDGSESYGYGVPINKLPSDILFEVFKAGALLDDDLDVDVPFAFTVSHVGSRWRRVALDSTVIWTSLAIAMKPNDEQRQSPFVTLLLRRSSGLPIKLRLTIAFGHDSGGWVLPALRLSPSVFGPIFERCESLTINCPSAPAIQLEDVFRSPLSVLTRLELVNVRVPSHISLAATFQSTPSLRRLSLDNCGVLSLPWPLDPIPVLPELTALSFFEGGHPLTRFSLSDLFKFIHTPNLRDLRCVHHERPLFNEALLSPPNFSAIRNIDFQLLWAFPLTFLETLQSMPSLEILKLSLELREAVPELLPSHPPLPALVEVELQDSCACQAHATPGKKCPCFDRLARFLVDQTIASLKLFTFSAELQALSEETKEWIRARVPGTLA